MSGLTRWLVWDRERPAADGEAKTPAFIDVPVHESLDDVIVSVPGGGFQVVDRSGRSQENSSQRIGSFELDPSTEPEDQKQADLLQYVYTEAARREWGNVVAGRDIGEEFLSEVDEYFDTFGLECASIHAGGAGIRELLRQDVIEATSSLGEQPSDSALQEVMSEEYAIGKVDGIPLFFNRGIDDLILFSAKSEYVGIGIRIRGRVGILLHNPERGMILAKVDA